METFKQYYIKNLHEQTKKHHVGTCVNSFDGGGENCNHHVPYHNASHFANHVQDWVSGGNKPEHKISKHEFENKVHIPKELHHVAKRKDTEFLHDKEHNAHMMYDAKKDVHHFFA